MKLASLSLLVVRSGKSKVNHDGNPRLGLAVAITASGPGAVQIRFPRSRSLSSTAVSLQWHDDEPIGRGSLFFSRSCRAARYCYQWRRMTKAYFGESGAAMISADMPSAKVSCR